MAADVALDFDASNPCCAKVNYLLHAMFSLVSVVLYQFSDVSFCFQLKKKFLKLEASRNALRQAVHILEQQVDKLEGENANLRKGTCTRFLLLF